MCPPVVSSYPRPLRSVDQIELSHAAARGDLDAVRHLVETTYVLRGEAASAGIRAARDGHRDVVRFILEQLGPPTNDETWEHMYLDGTYEIIMDVHRSMSRTFWDHILDED